MRTKPRLTKINRENSNLAELNEDPTRTDQDKDMFINMRQFLAILWTF